MYGKFFASAFTGSLMGAGADVFAVWGYVIANAVDSSVELNPRLLAAVIGISEERASAAIEALCAPDPRSRSKTAEGRRLIRDGEYAYTVPNHSVYRAIRSEDDRRAYNRRKQAEHRARVKASVNVKAPVNDICPVSAHTEAEAEAEAEAARRSDARARVGVWGPSDWKTQYGRAWCDRYRQVAYGMPSDSKACASLAEVLEVLPDGERLKAQSESSRMFAEFLGNADPRLAQRRHPFAFFVQEWGGLRVPKAAAAPPAPRVAPWIAAERDREEKRGADRSESRRTMERLTAELAEAKAGS